MSGEIVVVGWEAASVIARQLVENGYEVKIESDVDFKPEKELVKFIVSFVHPKWDLKYFDAVEMEDLEALRTWEDIKKEIKDVEVRMEECEECKVGGKGKGK